MAISNNILSTEDLENGKKRVEYKNGDQYEGDWGNNGPEGEGTMLCSNGDKYEGQWKNGLQDGKGIYTSKNGDRYEGNWKGGRKDGAMKAFCKSGLEMELLYLDGKLDGEYKVYYPDGTIYKGIAAGGKRSHKGTFYFPKGKCWDKEDKGYLMKGINSMKELYERGPVEVIESESFRNSKKNQVNIEIKEEPKVSENTIGNIEHNPNSNFFQSQNINKINLGNNNNNQFNGLSQSMNIINSHPYNQNMFQNSINNINNSNMGLRQEFDADEYMKLSETLHTDLLTNHSTKKKELGVNIESNGRKQAKIRTYKGFDRNQQSGKGNRLGNINQTNQQPFGLYGKQSYNMYQQPGRGNQFSNMYQQPSNWQQFSNMNQSMNQLNYMNPLLMDQLNCMTKQSFGFNNQLNNMNRFSNMNQQPVNMNNSYIPMQQLGQISNFNPNMQQFNSNQQQNIKQNQLRTKLNINAQTYIPKNINPNINNMNQQQVNMNNNSNIPGQNHNFNSQTQQFNDNLDMKLNLEAKPFYPKNINPNINNGQPQFFENGKENGQGRGGEK